MSTQQNSEFLLGLLLEENKHLNLIDFINKQDKASSYCCVCVSLACAFRSVELCESFTNMDSFSAMYFDIYASALENYRSIVGQSIRQILVDEAKIFYPQPMVTLTTNNLVTNHLNKQNVLDSLETVKNDHSYMIILRDDIAFIAIHHAGDNFIIIDPHVEYCGVLSKIGIYRYIVYDSIWNFDVHVMMPVKPVQISQTIEDTVIAQTIEVIIDQTVTDPIDTSTNVVMENNVVQTQ